MFERVTTHYQTLQTWIGHDATRYHNFNALPYIFSKKNVLKKITVTRGNALQIAQTQANLRETIR